MNYNESSDEDEFDSPLVSPARPPPTREGSPQLLAIPTLSDNVDDELAAVTQTLRNVGHTHTFRGTRPDPEGENATEELGEAGPEVATEEFGEADPEGVEEVGSAPVGEEAVSAEEVVEGFVFQGGENLKLGAGGDGGNGAGGDDGGAGGDDNESGDDANMAVDYDAENKDDGDKAQELARSIKLEFEPNDIVFWFSQLEGEMLMASVNSQWLKKQYYSAIYQINRKKM